MRLWIYWIRYLIGKVCIWISTNVNGFSGFVHRVGCGCDEWMRYGVDYVQDSS